MIGKILLAGLLVLVIGLSGCASLPETCVLGGDQEQIDACFDFAAQVEKDASLCERVQEENPSKLVNRGKCLYNLARRTEDITVCDRIEKMENQDWTSPSWRCMCYMDHFSKKMGASLCTRIEEDQSCNDTCYLSIASSSKDPSLCEKVQHTRAKELCFYSLAEEKQDPGLCEKIQDREVKQNCLRESGAVLCTESDLGINYFEKGSVQDHYDEQPVYDYCTLDGREVSSCTNPNQNCGIIEHYCDRNNRNSGHYIMGEEFDSECPLGCEDGACISS